MTDPAPPAGLVHGWSRRGFRPLTLAVAVPPDRGPDTRTLHGVRARQAADSA